MSDYLCSRVLSHPNIDVVTNTELSDISRHKHVESIEMTHNQTHEQSILACGGVFIFVGAKPYTDWLPETIQLDNP